MSKHTPGPWLAFRGSAFWEVIPQRKGGERKPPYQIADTCSSDPGNPDKGLQEANARLISAAPELLEAIEAAIASGMVPGESITGGPGTKTQQGKAAAMLRAAIAKAKGLENE